MAKAPPCRSCGHPHFSTQPHARIAVTPSVTHSPAVTREVTQAAQPVTPPVTRFEPTVTELVDAGATGEHECPVCGLVHRRVPATPAERQKAYRQRQALRQ